MRCIMFRKKSFGGEDDNDIFVVLALGYGPHYSGFCLVTHMNTHVAVILYLVIYSPFLNFFL